MSVLLNVQFSGLCLDVDGGSVQWMLHILCSQPHSEVEATHIHKNIQLKKWMPASLTILCRCLLPRPPHLPPVPRRWLKSVLFWNCWGEPESAEEDRDDWHGLIKTPTSLLKWRVTCCSLLDPFCFRFRRPSYCFRPSRYSATASLDGCFSGGESLYVIHVNEGGKDVWGWGEIGVLKRVSDLTPPGQRWTDRLQSASENSDSHLPWWES